MPVSTLALLLQPDLSHPLAACYRVGVDTDVNATDVYVQFQVGWLADPLFFGDYPAVMRASQKHLPKFKDAEKKLLAGSVDFLALNYYTSHFVAAAPPGAPKTQVSAQQRVT